MVCLVGLKDPLYKLFLLRQLYADGMVGCTSRLD